MCELWWVFIPSCQVSVDRALTSQGWQPAFALCMGQQGMSHTGNVICRNVSTSLSHRAWSILIPAVDPGPPFPLPEMVPGPPCSFTITCPLHCSFPSFVSSFPSFPTPFPHLLFPFPPEEAIFLPCPAHPSPAELRSRPLPWDSAVAGGSASKLLGWQTSTWAHYSRVGDMVITCLPGKAAPPASGMLTGMDTGAGQRRGKPQRLGEERTDP